MDGWNTSFLLGRPIFRGYVSFREGISKYGMPSSQKDIPTNEATVYPNGPATLSRFRWLNVFLDGISSPQPASNCKDFVPLGQWCQVPKEYRIWVTSAGMFWNIFSWCFIREKNGAGSVRGWLVGTKLNCDQDGWLFCRGALNTVLLDITINHVHYRPCAW